MVLMTLSRLTCPHCGFEEDLKMPSDACQFFHQCARCGTMLKPQSGDCCVFCSYGDVKCPSIQKLDGRQSRETQVASKELS